MVIAGASGGVSGMFGAGPLPDGITGPVEQDLDRLVAERFERVLLPKAGAGERVRQRILGEPSDIPAFERVRS
jgi:hypothetical protein